MRWLLLALLGFAGMRVESADLPELSDNSGFIYGTVTMKNGTVHRGFLRWADQEAFWDDHLNGTKDRTPYQEFRKDGKDGSSGFNLLSFVFNRGARTGTGRQFLARFGDVQRITVTGARSADILMKNHKNYGVTGWGDIGTNIQVNDGSGEVLALEWEAIQTIEFQAAPAGLAPPQRRMYGTVHSDKGTFRGHILWDKQECMADDIIDGEEGDKEYKIAMGRIRTIEKVDKKSCTLTLRNGERLTLRGTNDVNRENRGIDIEDERFGRVTVYWRAFQKLTFEDHMGSGRAYDGYQRHHLLHGKVTDRKGETFMGRLVFDLDESERWEIMDGEEGKVAYAIPFGIIDTMEPAGRRRCKVALINGESLVLGGTNDVDTGNGGLLIYEYNENPPKLMTWRQIKQVKFNNIDLERAMAAKNGN